MNMTDETINEAIYNIRNQMLMDYCERRIGQGATTAQLNAELKGYIPQINAWSRRQRTLLKLIAG